MNKRTHKHLVDAFGAIDRVPAGMLGFIDAIDREFDDFDRRVRAMEQAFDENALDLVISNVSLNNYLNASSDLIFRIDSSDTIVDYVANQDYLGLNLDQFTNGPVKELPLCDDPAFFSNALQQVRDLKLNLAIEYPVEINRAEYYLNARFMPISEREIIMAIRDITREKKALRDLVRSEKNYRDLLGLIPYPVVVHQNMELVYVNDAAVELMGAGNAEKLMGTNIRSYIHPDSIDNVTRMFKEHGSGAIKQISSREKIIDFSGDEFAVNIISSIIPWKDGKAILVIGRNITSEVKMRERLYRAEEMYRLLTENIHDVIWMVDQVGNLLYVSPAITRITGYVPAEYTRESQEKHFTKQSLAVLRREIDSLFTRNQGHDSESLPAKNIEIEIKKNDGQIAVLEMSLSLSTFGDDNPVVIGVFRDITERKKMEHTLHQAEKWRDLLLETTTDIIYTLDAEVRFTYVSPKFHQVTGHGADELMGRPVLDFVDPLQREMIAETFRRGIDEGEPSLYETELIFENGDRIPFEVNVSTIKGPDGRALGRLGVARDIRGKRETPRALAESERLYRMLAENLTDVIWTTDMSLSSTYISPSVEMMKGFTPEEILNMKVTEIFTPESLARLLAVFADELKKEEQGGSDPGRTRTIQAREHCKNGSVIFTEIKTKFMRDENGRAVGILGVTRDITERVRADEALVASRARLRGRPSVGDADIEAAQIIQRAFLSDSLPQFHGLQIQCRYLPLDGVGGDYYSFTNLREGALSVFVGDVASHGVAAALYLSLVKATINRVMRDHALEPKEFIEELNRELVGNMPLSFLTAVYGVFRKNPHDASMSFTFTSSGHPSPMVYRKGDDSMAFFRCRGSLIGIFDDISVGEREVTLHPGDRLFLYTDGLPETTNPDNQIWGFDRLPEHFAKANRPTLNETLDALIDDVNAFRRGTPFDDDIVVIGFEV
jgi:PAS domain S-box-containing protein